MNHSTATDSSHGDARRLSASSGTGAVLAAKAGVLLALLFLIAWIIASAPTPVVPDTTFARDGGHAAYSSSEMRWDVAPADTTVISKGTTLYPDPRDVQATEVEIPISTF